MESYFNTILETNTETDNLLYNIINSQDPKQIFLYVIIIVFVCFISTQMSYNTNILIGLIFGSLFICYLYTYRKYNIISNEQMSIEKFNELYSKNNILKKYPKIVNFLFYMENFKYYNIEGFNNLIDSFENFCKVYEYCLIDTKLIFTNYKILVDQKIRIMSQINNFTFVVKNIKLSNILIKQSNAAEEILNNLLNNLVLLYKKNIYYNGYDNKVKNIDYSNILPYNILYDPNYKKHSDQYNISNLIFF